MAFDYPSIPSPAAERSEQLVRLVYELADAHSDTQRLMHERPTDLQWHAHLRYLRDLQRLGARSSPNRRAGSRARAPLIISPGIRPAQKAEPLLSAFELCRELEYAPQVSQQARVPEQGCKAEGLAEIGSL